MASNSPIRRTCGTWPSPITTAMVTEPVTTIEDVIVDPITSIIYHIENRPSQGGRSVLVESVSGRDISEESLDVKTLVNHYGRAAASICNGLLYFNNLNDHRVYRQSLPNHHAIPITPANEPFRFAFFTRHPKHPHIIFTVKEDHTNPTANGIVTTLCYIDTRRASVHTLVSGSDFYVNPTVNASGTQLAWLEWNHPHMQWKGAQLLTADIDISPRGDGVSLTNTRIIAGDPGQNAVYQFAWCPPDYDTDMVVVWDKTEFAEPWIYTPGRNGSQTLRAVFGQPNSFQTDFADPSWWLDESSFIFLEDNGTTLWVTTKEGRSYLNFLNIVTGELTPIKPNPYTEITRVRRVDHSTVVYIGTAPKGPPSLIRMRLNRTWSTPAPSWDVLFTPPEPPVENSMIPSPKSFKIPKRDGNFTFAHFYPPANPHYAPLADEKPPCLLSLHPGPTIRSQIGFQLLRLYYTSRGFAWLDVDYCGSTGYGKDYRNRLEGQYGVADIEDIIAATEYLSTHHIFDRRRVCLRTTHGGTFPALQAFTQHPDVFFAATVHFLVADLAEAWQDPTDKPTIFYLSNLMGGTPQEIPEVYRDRNPVLHADRITRPLLITNYRTGSTASQAEKIINAIRRKGGRVDYLFFEPTLSHREVLQELLERELSFFVDVLT